MHPAIVLLLGCTTAAAQDSLAVCDLNTDLPESIGTVNLKFSESVMVHNNLGGKGGKDAHNDDDPHEIRRAALPSPRIYPRSTNLTPALRRTRRLSNIARLQVLDAAIAAGMLPDAQVSCQAMWEAYGPIFFPGSKVRGTDSKFAFDWQQSCCPCAAANTTAVDPMLGMTSVAYCTLAGLAPGDGATSCAETMVTINQKHIYHVLNPTGATVDIGSDIVVTNRSEYDPKNPKQNGIVLTNADDGSTGGLVQINVRANTSVDMRMRTKPSCCLDLVSDGELSACEWWEAAPFDEAAFATLKTEVEGSSNQEIVDFQRTDGATLADLQNAMETSVLLCIDFFLNRDPRKGCTLEQAFTDALAQPEDWEFTSWDEGRSWEEAGCALPLPKGHRVCRHNPDKRGRFAPRSEPANKMQAKLYKCPLKETHQTLPNVLASISVYDFDDNRQTKEGTDLSLIHI